jgi:hypothetical protein
MIQRKQTLFLLVAFILSAACMCMPIGNVLSEGMGVDTNMYNLWTVEPNGTHKFSVWPLFALLLLTFPLCLAAIFSYKKRLQQARLCQFCVLLLVAWYAVWGIKGWVTADGAFRPAIASAFPLISIVLYLLARKAILADEALVRAADRIR